MPVFKTRGKQYQQKAQFRRIGMTIGVLARMYDLHCLAIMNKHGMACCLTPRIVKDNMAVRHIAPVAIFGAYTWSHIAIQNHCNSSKSLAADRCLLKGVYAIFKWVVETWLNGKAPGDILTIGYHVTCPIVWLVQSVQWVILLYSIHIYKCFDATVWYIKLYVNFFLLSPHKYFKSTISTVSK